MGMTKFIVFLIKSRKRQSENKPEFQLAGDKARGLWTELKRCGARQTGKQEHCHHVAQNYMVLLYTLQHTH